MNKSLIFGLTGVFLASCDNGNDGVTNSAQELTQSDFNVTATPVSSADIQTFLEESGFIFNSGLTRVSLANEFNGISDQDPCFPGGSTLSSGDSGYIVSLNNTNVASCNSDSSISLSNFTVAAYYDFLTLYDLSGNPLTIMDLPSLLTSDISGISVRARYYYDVNGSANIYGQVFTIDLTAYGTLHGISSFDSPCAIINDVIHDCVTEVVTIDVNDGVTEVKRTQLTFNNVEELADAPYYGSGTVSFIANNWTGTVTYYGGFVPPSFTATNGSQTVSGTLYNFWY